MYRHRTPVRYNPANHLATPAPLAEGSPACRVAGWTHHAGAGVGGHGLVAMPANLSVAASVRPAAAAARPARAYRLGFTGLASPAWLHRLGFTRPAMPARF